MFDQFKKAAQNLADTIKDQTNQFGESAKEKSLEMIENWIRILPKLQSYGLEMTSYGVVLAISPSLDVELMGPREKFTREKLMEMKEENKADKSLTMVFKAILTAYELYEKSGENEFDTMFIKIRVKVPPEIWVIFGQPRLF